MKPPWRALFARYRELGRPIRGIVHAAGIISERPIDGLGEQDFEAVFQAKIGGTWALHQVSQNKDIDFLIFFSSASAILGGKDLTHYAAANSFLDAMAHYRKSMGRSGAERQLGFVGRWKCQRKNRPLF